MPRGYVTITLLLLPIKYQEIIMKPFSLRIFNYKFWTRVVLFSAAVLLIHGFVKALTIYLAPDLGMFNVGREFWIQLFSIQMFPTIAAYVILASIAYFQFVKVGRIMNHLHAKDIEMERGKATVETMQKVTAYMAEYISIHNNEILTWISKKREKGDIVPRAVEVSTSKISEAMSALSEISFIMPYDKTETNPSRYIDILKERLDGIATVEKQAV
jgi:hypothetical protein